MVVFGEKLLYPYKSGCVRAKNGCILAEWMYSGKLVVFGQSDGTRKKMVVFGKKWLYSCKFVVFVKKWLYSRKVVVFWQ